MTVEDLIGKKPMDSAWARRGPGLRAGNSHRKPVSLVGLRRWRDGCGLSLRDPVRNGLSHRLHFGAPAAASSVDVVSFAVVLGD